MPTWTIRPLSAEEAPAVRAWMLRQWHAETVVGHGEVMEPARLPGFVASDDHTWLGLVTYRCQGAACEIVTIDSLREGEGIGTALLEAVVAAARHAGCQRIWLITTNDNLPALRFYQRRDFVLVAVHRRAVEAARKLKPSIPALGYAGIPIRDELELERLLEPET